MFIKTKKNNVNELYIIIEKWELFIIYKYRLKELMSFYVINLCDIAGSTIYYLCFDLHFCRSLMNFIYAATRNYEVYLYL